MTITNIDTPTRTTSPFDSIRRTTEAGREYWSARELMPLLGYDSWRRFEETIERAMVAVKNTGANEFDHFADTGKVIDGGRWSTQTVTDYEMTRFGAYMVAMNGDPRKPEIAAAQAYFAIQTRVAETAPAPALSGAELMAQALIEAHSTMATYRARVDELTPMASAWEKLASATGDYSVRDAAQVLCRDGGIQVGQNRLFTHLKTAPRPWLDKHTRPYQWAVDAGLVAEKISSFKIQRTNGDEQLATPQVRITAKGLQRLHKELSPSKEMVKS